MYDQFHANDTVSKNKTAFIDGSLPSPASTDSSVAVMEYNGDGMASKIHDSNNCPINTMDGPSSEIWKRVAK